MDTQDEGSPNQCMDFGGARVLAYGLSNVTIELMIVAGI